MRVFYFSKKTLYQTTFHADEKWLYHLKLNLNATYSFNSFIIQWNHLPFSVLLFGYFFHQFLHVRGFMCFATVKYSNASFHCAIDVATPYIPHMTYDVYICNICVCVHCIEISRLNLKDRENKALYTAASKQFLLF